MLVVVLEVCEIVGRVGSKNTLIGSVGSDGKKYKVPSEVKLSLKLMKKQQITKIARNCLT